MDQVLQQKKGLVKGIFNKVFKKYDIMNDLMSLGIHRIWKKNLIQMMNPTSKKKTYRCCLWYWRYHQIILRSYK